jgi:hypothetical protein
MGDKLRYNAHVWCWMHKVCSGVLKVCPVAVWMRMWTSRTQYILKSIGGSIWWCDDRFPVTVSDSIIHCGKMSVCIWPVSSCSWTFLSSSWLQLWRTEFSQCRIVNIALELVTRTVWCWTAVPGYITYFVFLKWHFWLMHLWLLWMVRQWNRASCYWLTSLAQGTLCTPQWLSVIKNAVQTKHPERVKLYVSHMALLQRW